MKSHSVLCLSLVVACLGALSGCGGSSTFGSLTGTDDASTGTEPDAGSTPADSGVDSASVAGCRTSLDCPTGKVCDPTARSCFDCVADNDCDPGKKCQNHACVVTVPRCQTSADCAASAAGKVCDKATGNCVTCVVQNDCPPNNDCVANGCKPYTPCKNSLDCPNGLVCNPDAGRCVECLGANDCGAEQVCAGNACRKKCLSDTQCTVLGLLCDPAKGYCVSCVAAGDCKPEQFCSNGACAPDVCAAGSATCQQNAVVTCRADGSGFGGASACSSQQVCVAAQGTASCKDRICTPSVVACDTQSEKVVQCSADGLSLSTKADCAAINSVCTAAACTPIVCEAGKQYCQAGAVRKCSAKGDTSTLVQTCTAAQYCDPATAACKPLLCTPSSVVCDTQSEKVLECAIDGLSFSTKVDCATSIAVCIAAMCTPVVCEAGKQFCQASTVRKCSAKGDTSTLVQTCTAAQYCDAVSATCKALVCAPNQPACNNQIATTCNADGTGYEAGGIDCSPKSCSGGVCVDCPPATDVAYNGKCYYLDGSRKVCDPGYTLVSQSVLTNIAPLFANKNYKHKVSDNCCIANSDGIQNWGMAGHCNSAGPFTATDVKLGGASCTNTMQDYPAQLTLCGSL